MANRIGWDVEKRRILDGGVGGGLVGQISFSRLVNEMFRQTNEIRPTERA